MFERSLLGTNYPNIAQSRSPLLKLIPPKTKDSDDLRLVGGMAHCLANEEASETLHPRLALVSTRGLGDLLL